MAKQKKKRADNSQICVEVLQHGTTMAKTSWPIKKMGTMSIVSEKDGELAIPYYPLPNKKVSFLRNTKGGTWLLVDYNWEGFCTSGGVLTNIEGAEKGQNSIQLHRGDYASIGRDDLRIMIKIIAHTPLKKEKRRPPKEYRAGLTNLYVTQKSEWSAVAGAFFIALMLVGGLTMGLSQRVYVVPQTMSDLEPEWLLPFVGPDRIATSPEALQANLDRNQLIKSTMSYYHSLTDTLMGWQTLKTPYIFDTTVDLFKNLHHRSQAIIDEKTTFQSAIDQSILSKDGKALLLVPTVIGESFEGSLLRVVDKIDIAQKGFRLSLRAKRDIVPDFLQHKSYNYEEYENEDMAIRRRRPKTRINPWELATNEKRMYLDSHLLSKAAFRVQEKVKEHASTLSLKKPKDHGPIEIPAGIHYATFLSDVNFMLADDKISLLRATRFGKAPPKKIKREPLIGEIDPKLVQDYIRKNIFQLQLCYERALRRNDKASGTMEWRWQIDTRGKTSEVALLGTQIADFKMEQCIAKKINQWRFPRPRRGSIEIRYPFEFTPAKG